MVKGGRGAKKSTTAALWYIYHLMKYPLSNLLVVRRFANGHKDSTFAQLQWAIEQLGVEDYWRSTKSPLELRYLPTDQKILFRGLDDPQSIHSLTVEKGYLCWVWIEEAFQIESESDFNKLDMSIRGAMPQEYFKQLTLTFNPWNESHWLKKRFFQRESPDILALTRTYMDNEFLDWHDRGVFEEMKQLYPRRYAVEGKGEWGIAEGLVYENWEVLPFDVREELKKRPHAKALFGLDFGFTQDPTAFICLFADEKSGEIFIFDEFYRRGMLNSEIAAAIREKGYAKERIIADGAEPKSIAELRHLGLSHVTSAKKGPDSLRYGIQRLCNFRIFVHPRCVHTKEEFSSYLWATAAEGQMKNVPQDKNNHLMDALRYAMEGLGKNMLILK